MMEIVESLYRIIGSLICHQLPERTICLNGIPLPLCARDSGIYLGVFVSLGFMLAWRRFDSDRPPSVGCSLVMCFLMLPMLADGITSYMGLRETNNEIRLITGALFGTAIPVFLLPVRNFSIDSVNRKQIIKSWTELVSMYISGLLCCTVFLWTAIVPWLVGSTVILFSLTFTVHRLIFTVVSRTRLARRRYWRVVTILLTAGVFGIMYIFSSLILQPLKERLLF